MQPTLDEICWYVNNRLTHEEKVRIKNGTQTAEDLQKIKTLVKGGFNLDAR